MKAVLIVLEALIKILIGVVLGIGTAALVFGCLLYGTPQIDFGHDGPPLAETLISVGIGLLTIALTLLILFVGPFSGRRWFVLPESTAQHLPEPDYPSRNLDPIPRDLPDS